MKKIIFTLVLFLVPSIILANEISNIDMNIYVDNNGTAHVTEEWTAELNEGTEGYKPYYGLGESKISNFKVSMNGKEYTYNSNYNINASFDEKKYTNGFNYVNDGVELCFGITKYGKNTYTLSYDISNFVLNTSDGYQMIYWTLFPKNYKQSPERVYIKIYSDFKYADNLDVWGYGKYGAPTYVYDGYIEMDSESTVSSSEYMTILVKFPENTFTLSTTLDKTFDEYLNMANEGSTKYDNTDGDNSSPSIFYYIWQGLTYVLSFGIPLFIVFAVGSAAIKNGYGYKNNKTIDKKNTPLYRDIPCNKDIFKGYFIATAYKLGIRQTDFFGTLFLKWLFEDKIKLEKREVQKIFKTKTIDVIILYDNLTFDNNCEKKFYDILVEASKDYVLEPDELEKWSKVNYSKLLNMTESFEKCGRDKYINESKVEDKRSYYILKDTLKEEAERVYGLKKYLKEFTRIKEKSAITVKLWKEYLMFAQIFGIANKVATEFKRLYPEEIMQYSKDYDFDFNTIYVLNNISHNMVQQASSARSAAESYSSGGGGFSSGGGGGGSFGGGGGGGR